MNTIMADRTVGELVTEKPARSRVFEKFGIDFCCGGKKLLVEACSKRGVPLQGILDELGALDALPPADNVQCSDMALDKLVDHIVATHHAYLQLELPRLTAMADKVAKVHGQNDERLPIVATVARELADELASHLQKEERILFPIIQQLACTAAIPSSPCGSIANPIRVMEHEHDGAGDALGRLRALTDGYTPPDGACNTYRALLDGLRELEADLHQHIHKENNILFPRALALEQSLL